MRPEGISRWPAKAEDDEAERKTSPQPHLISTTDYHRHHRVTTKTKLQRRPTPAGSPHVRPRISESTKSLPKNISSDIGPTNAGPRPPPSTCRDEDEAGDSLLLTTSPSTATAREQVAASTRTILILRLLLLPLASTVEHEAAERQTSHRHLLSRRRSPASSTALQSPHAQIGRERMLDAPAPSSISGECLQSAAGIPQTSAPHLSALQRTTTTINDEDGASGNDLHLHRTPIRTARDVASNLISSPSLLSSPQRTTTTTIKVAAAFRSPCAAGDEERRGQRWYIPVEDENDGGSVEADVAADMSSVTTTTAVINDEDEAIGIAADVAADLGPSPSLHNAPPPTCHDEDEASSDVSLLTSPNHLHLCRCPTCAGRSRGDAI
ncbi:hypothetical protein R3P38DRAFT_3259460 [Favolaschia claudopus]|uniref:Uncharacterized protein n=1 Tax=Favolaschia claudopus TaxID=2862362 RepID=A0AAW0CXV3_9AGAR